MSNLYVCDANGGEFASKKAFREFVAEAGDSVYFADTSAVNSRGQFIGTDNPALTSSDVIVGPNPWNNRKWYANIRNGRVV